MNLWKYTLFQVLRYTAFFVPVIVLFWQENGLSLTEIMILQSLFAIAIVVLEVPTGYFADAFGRRFSLVLASFCMVFALGVYVVGTGFWFFLAAELLMALYTSLVSGANSALVYDTLREIGRENEYQRVWGRMIAVGLVTLAISNVAGGFIGSFEYRLTFFAMLPFAVMLVPLAWSIDEPAHHRMVVREGYLRDMMSIVTNALRRNERLRWLIIYSGVTFASFQAVLWFYQPYFVSTGIGVAYFGLIFASFQIVAAIGARYAYRFERWFGMRRSLAVMTLSLTASYVLMSGILFAFSFVFAYVQQLVRGYYKTVISDYVNQIAASEERATILSVQSLFGQLAYAVVIPLLGVLADVYTVAQAIGALAVFAFVSGGLSLLLLFRSHSGNSC